MRVSRKPDTAINEAKGKDAVEKAVIAELIVTERYKLLKQELWSRGYYVKEIDGT